MMVLAMIFLDMTTKAKLICVGHKNHDVYDSNLMFYKRCRKSKGQKLQNTIPWAFPQE